MKERVRDSEEFIVLSVGLSIVHIRRAEVLNPFSQLLQGISMGSME